MPDPLIADVAIDIPGRDCYSYLVPAELADQVVVGAGVSVPFGRRQERAFVVGLEHRPPPEGVTLKAIDRCLPHVRLPAKLLQLLRWGAAYYRCSTGEFLAGAVPAPVREGVSVRPERLLRKIIDADVSGLTKRQLSIWTMLPRDEAMDLATACRFASTTRPTLTKLIDAGVVELIERRLVQEVRLAAALERHPLTEEQQAAVDAVQTSLDEGTPRPFFLYGVTGSGKTLVYMELAESVINAGRQALILLPEIGLTPQLAARFRKRFERVAVVHSNFTAGERAEVWHAIARGEVDLIIGTRSALFAPMPKPGLIIVDEEHDSSYKQESTPRYHARDLAVVYGGQLGVPVILGSATPSLESYHNVQTGRYEVLIMRNRPAGGQLPRPEVIDMGEECRKQRRYAVLSEALIDGLKQARERGEQAIVLLNRRGWSPIVTCHSCGHTMECPHCDIGLTWHRGSDQLRCHYCGYWESMPKSCPACGQADLSTKGMGTEQLAAELGRQVDGLRILRLDADTVATRQGHAQILRRFAEREADCLVGTQMVAKGFDFPAVTLVGIVAADQGLGIPDFRAAERTYQLIAQVAGRAGRGERPGRVVVQAFDVEAPAISCAVANKAKTFYTRELDLRREYGYPPGNGLLRLLWRSPDAGKVQQVAEEHGQILQAAADGLPILGPVPAGLAYLQGQHRWHALVKGGSRGAIQRFLDRIDAAGGLPRRKDVSVAIDVDPYSIS